MKKKKLSAGESMLEGAKQALAFARGEKEHGCVVHIPDEIDVKAIRQKVTDPPFWPISSKGERKWQTLKD